MLARKNRLAKQKDFKNIFTKGRSCHSPGLILRFLSNNSETSRFAFVVSLKVDKRAVVRNRLRRQLSEIIKQNLNGLKTGIDIVLIAKAPLAEISYPELKKETEVLLKNCKLYV